MGLAAAYRISVASLLLTLAHAEPPTIEQAWDALLPGALPSSPHVPSAPALALVSPPQAVPNADFHRHFFFNTRTDFWRYSTSFTGSPTIAGVINAPNTGVFNPAGIPDTAIFQPSANRLYTGVEWGTRGWLSERVDTRFAFRYEQDLTHVNSGAAAQDILETFPSNRRLEWTQAAVDVRAAPGLSFTFGRQDVLGAELASFDGASATLNHGLYAVTLFAGRRFTYFSDPDQRALGGANVLVRLGPASSLEYDGLWYVKGSNRLSFRTRLRRSWTFLSYFRTYGGSPVDFSASAYYASPTGKANLRLSFFQKLSNKDYFFDYTYFARDSSSYNSLLRLYLGPLSPYSQFFIEAQRTLNPRLTLSGTVWLRRLNDSADQSAFDTSFIDYRLRATFLPLRKWELSTEYHQHDSDRIAPGNATTLDDITAAGETSVKDAIAEVRRNFFEGRLGFNFGAYYRRISLQDQFFVISGMHQSGFLTGAFYRIDAHSRIFANYDLDNDFALFRPDIAHSRILRLGVAWKY